MIDYSNDNSSQGRSYIYIFFFSVLGIKNSENKLKVLRPKF